MNKIKLLKPNVPIASGSVSKKIAVEDTKGNKHILKATIISVSQDRVQTEKGYSHEIEDSFEELGISTQIVRPPLSQAELAVLQEYSSELGQIIDTMAVGIEGFGGRLIERKCDEETKKKHEAQIREEKSFLSGLLELPNSEGTFVNLRKETREDLELTGNAYWELVPSFTKNGRYSAINKMDVSSMYITKTDKQLTPMALKYLDAGLCIHNKKFFKRFRRFVQVINNKKVWFKQFGDPRIIDRRTGEVADESLDARFRANEIYHFKIYTPKRTPYGMPRFTGNIIAIKGSRSADETNIITQQNNHVPSMAVMVSGGMLTEGSIQRLKEFVDSQIKGNSNYSKFLILEGESQHDGLSSASSMKIEIKPLSDAQHKDQLWQEYDKNNAGKLRRSFRVAPIMVGSSENYDRATAQTSEAMTEKYVFNPEREGMDEHINRIFLQQGIRFWVFKSNSPNVTNDEDLVAIITGGEKTGAVTPRIARMMLEDILNRELPGFDDIPPQYKEFFHPDVPFSMALAKMMTSAGAANANGTFAPQGQVPTPSGPNGRPPDNPDTISSTQLPGGEVPTNESQQQTADVKAVALNGAQVTALLQLVADVAGKRIPYDSGLQTIILGFGLTQQQAQAILNPTNGFVPAEDNPNPQQNPPSGPQPTAGKVVPQTAEEPFNSLDPHVTLNKLFEQPDKVLERLNKLRQSLEDDMDTEVFGQPKKDYFKHAT